MESLVVQVDEHGSTLRGEAAGPGPPALFEGRSNGAYTAASLRGSPFCITDWELHEKRLTRSMEKLRSINQQHPGEKADPSEFKPSDIPTVMQLVKQRVAAATAAYAELFERLNADQETQAPHTAKLFVYISVSASEDSRVLVHCSPALQPAQDGPVEVAVLGPPRNASLASTKYTHWIQERKYLEELKPKGVSEDGGITEGMVSNFCVIADLQDGRGDVLMTAGPSQPALQGIVLTRVVQAASTLQLRVELQAPQIQSRQYWKEAFISNCLRGLQPVSRISCPQANLCGQSEWELDLPHSHGPVTRRIQQRVLELQVQSPITLLT